VRNELHFMQLHFGGKPSNGDSSKNEMYKMQFMGNISIDAEKCGA
jgi:hypothetical protein